MLALTLWQPWAWAIAHLPAEVAKPVENRDWRPPASVVGTRIALHGGKTYDDDAADDILDITRAAGLRNLDTSRRGDTGILGTVRLVGVVEERNGRLVLVAGDWGEVTRERAEAWFVGRYGWLLDQRRVLDVPIPCRGAQGLWAVTDDVAARHAIGGGS